MFITSLRLRLTTAATLSTLFITSATLTRGADVRSLYNQAIKDYQSQNYPQSCRELKQLAEATGQFKSLPADALAQIKQTWKSTSGLSNATMLAAKNGKTAEACSGSYVEGLVWAAQEDWMMAGNATHFGGNYAEDLERETRRAAPQPSTAQNASTAASPLDTRAGSGAIPNGTYACFTATTARILAGGSGILQPGTFSGRILIKGDTYQVNEHSIGHYKVGPNGTLTWQGGEYSSKTLGRYVKQNGTPTIVIGWADTDAGLTCTPR
jgi:hypothetical protein